MSIASQRVDELGQVARCLRPCRRSARRTRCRPRATSRPTTATDTRHRRSPSRAASAPRVAGAVRGRAAIDARASERPTARSIRGMRTTMSSPRRNIALSVPDETTRCDREVGPLRQLRAQQPRTNAARRCRSRRRASARASSRRVPDRTRLRARPHRWVSPWRRRRSRRHRGRQAISPVSVSHSPRIAGGSGTARNRASSSQQTGEAGLAGASSRKRSIGSHTTVPASRNAIRSTTVVSLRKSRALDDGESYAHSVSVT